MSKCGTANHYPAGQCTVYADQRYHDLTGCFVPWSGNAWQWEGLAKTAGWNVSNTPRVPSIMVLQGGVQGASPLGHVGVVESINHDGSFISSNLNWGPNRKAITDVKHTPGKGVSFLSSFGLSTKAKTKEKTTSKDAGVKTKEAMLLTGTLTFDQTAQIGYNSGFRDGNLVTIVAIAAAESGLRIDAQNLADCCGGSWGILQLNGSHFHTGNTSKKCALDPQCAFDYAWGLSGGGTNFLPWGAFTNGSYTQFLSQAKTAAGHIKGVTKAGTKDTDPCAKCGAKGSDPYIHCTGQVASGNKADCGGNVGTTCENFFGSGSAICMYVADPIRILKIGIGVAILLVALFLLAAPAEQAVSNVVAPIAKSAAVLGL